MSALDNYIDHYFSGSAYYANGEFHNEMPESGDFYEVDFKDGILIEAKSYPHPIGVRYPIYTKGVRYPVHVINLKYSL